MAKLQGKILNIGLLLVSKNAALIASIRISMFFIGNTNIISWVKKLILKSSMR